MQLACWLQGPGAVFLRLLTDSVLLCRNNGGLTLFGVDTLDRSILTEELPNVLGVQQGNPPFVHFSELLGQKCFCCTLTNAVALRVCLACERLCYYPRPCRHPFASNASAPIACCGASRKWWMWRKICGTCFCESSAKVSTEEIWGYFVERCGFEEPLKQKFSSMVAPARLPELVFLLLIYAARGLPVSRSSGGMVFEDHCDLDPVVFSMGLACIMHQMTETSIQVSFLVRS